MIMNIYFTSDHHFGHANIIRYCQRPFATAEEMNEQLIANWNGTVGPNDIVYVLGDMFFCDVQKARSIMRRLHGMKRLVYGNHDKIIRNQTGLRELFDRILPDLYEESINWQRMVMCHYPMLTWNKAHHGSINVHGHQHNKVAITATDRRRYDVGVDANDYRPVKFQDIVRQLQKIEPARGRED
jgi:calcineurin-like phosphoesterase family protein